MIYTFRKGYYCLLVHKLELPNQQTPTCSKSTTETLEKGVKHQNDIIEVVLVFLLLI